MTKYFLAASFLISAQLMGTAFSQEPTPSLQLVPEKPAPAGEKGELFTLTINCYTNVQNCYGRAYWKNNDNNRYASVSVYFNNGAGGQSNFVLEPGGDHYMSGIRYNDTEASVWGNGGVPSGTPRRYIYVCCN